MAEKAGRPVPQNRPFKVLRHGRTGSLERFVAEVLSDVLAIAVEDFVLPVTALIETRTNGACALDHETTDAPLFEN